MIRRRIVRAPVVAAALILGLGSCSDVLEVENPNVINADGFDLTSEGAMLANSAMQELASAYGWMILHTALFTWEALTADTDLFENTVNRRDVDAEQSGVTTRIGTHLRPVSRAIAMADFVLNALAKDSDFEKNLNVAKAAFTSGYALIWMGEKFCIGVINVGPPLTPVMVLDSAVARLTLARSVALAAVPTLSGATQQQARDLANAALVGIARAHLQAGRLTEAIAAADQVPAGFTFVVRYQRVVGVDDARVANLPYIYSYFNRPSYSVAPAFRNLGDSRVPVTDPSKHTIVPFDGITPLWLQAKWPAANTPIRLASRLEADYLAAEARGVAAMLALIQTRRAAAGLAPYAGPTDQQNVIVEFLDQRSREFFMEAKRLGDSRRHPGLVRNIPNPGAPYHKSGYGPMGSDTCWPLPVEETRNNPHFKNN